ncbi:MAG: extracellular solute-binding protein [Sporomusaceae bacterium]|nr:extracellular solute-binding protein [Sporomusaceae bacterium]
MRRYVPLLFLSFFLVFAAIIGTDLLGHAGNQTPENLKSIVVYTNLPVEQVSLFAQEYEKSAKIRVQMVPLSDQDLLQKLQNERQTPQADLVLATEAVLRQVQKEHLLAPVTSEQTDIVPDRFKDKDNFWVGTWYDPIVFAVNRDFAKKLSQPIQRWADLGKDSQVRLAMTDFLASEASASLLYSLRSLQGEQPTLAFFKKIHPQVIQYAKFLATPVRMAGMGEADVAIAVQSETIRYYNDGFPLTIVYPDEGTAYSLTGIALTLQGPHSADAAPFIDWILQNEAQELLQNHRFYFVPTNPETNIAKFYETKHMKLFDSQPLTPVEQHTIMDKWIQSVRLSPRSL